MNTISIYTIKSLKKFYTKYFWDKPEKPECDQNPDSVSQKIYDALMKEEPCMIARFGSTELLCLVNYIGVKNKKKSYLKYIKGNAQPWWWEKNILNQMQQWSGFFPPTEDKIEQFCELMLQDIPEVDILGSWLEHEKHFEDSTKAEKVHLRLLEPFWAKAPWTKALQDKKVLIVHPFSDLIRSQYDKRKLLFENEDCLPKFKSLHVIKAVQSLGEGDIRFIDWFEALEYMKSEIDKVDYDMCLIGCGAYGFHLAAHVKRRGKKGIHIGGALQLMFGIKGQRWEDPNYGVKVWGIPYGSYSNLINENWVRPGDELKPQNANQVEGACYW